MLLALLFLIAAPVFAARWIATHPDQVRAMLYRQLARPTVATFRRRYQRQLAFLTRRLQPGSAFGLSLTLGLLALIALGWAFGGILEDVVGREELATIDSPVTSWLADHRVAWLTTVMRLATQLGGTAVIVTVLAATAATLYARTRRWQPAAFLFVVAVGASGLVTIVKLLIARTRPDIGYVIGALDGSAFPSSHSTQTVASYGALAWLATRNPTRWAQRVTIWAAVILLALLVGFSRLYLGAHYLTDVLGGYALGAAWLATTITATTVYRRAHNHDAISTAADDVTRQVR